MGGNHGESRSGCGDGAERGRVVGCSLGLLVGAVLGVGGAGGCIIPNVPPTMSLAKYVRDPRPKPATRRAPEPTSTASPESLSDPAKGARDESLTRPRADRGRVAVSTGVAFYLTRDVEPEKTPLEGRFFFFPVEGALSLFLGSRYDLAVGVNSNFLLELSGNAAVVATRGFRLSLLHGLGVGLQGCLRHCEDEERGTGWGGLLAYNASVGVMAQVVAGRGVLFVGSRYSFASHAELGDAEDDTKDNWTHWVTSSMGYQFRVGWLRITPEVIFSYGSQRYIYTYNGANQKSRTENWLILPSVTLAAGF